VGAPFIKGTHDVLIYLSRVFIAFSIFLNALLGGKNNQTLSATQWERKRKNIINIVWIIDKVFWWEDSHCNNAWIKWQIINNAINRYDGIAAGYYSGTKKKK
jgi:hypothetical protein